MSLCRKAAPKDGMQGSYFLPAPKKSGEENVHDFENRDIEISARSKRERGDVILPRFPELSFSYKYGEAISKIGVISKQFYRTVHPFITLLSIGSQGPTTSSLPSVTL